MTNEESRVIEAAKKWRKLASELTYVSRESPLSQELIDAVDALNTPIGPSASMEEKWADFRLWHNPSDYSYRGLRWVTHKERSWCIYSDGKVYIADDLNMERLVELHGPEKFKVLESMPSHLVQAASVQE